MFPRFPFTREVRCSTHRQSIHLYEHLRQAIWPHRLQLYCAQVVTGQKSYLLLFGEVPPPILQETWLSWLDQHFLQSWDLSEDIGWNALLASGWTWQQPGSRLFHPPQQLSVQKGDHHAIFIVQLAQTCLSQAPLP